MNIILLGLLLLTLVFAYALYVRNKHYKDYIARKEHDQRFNQGERKGWKW